MQRCIFIFFFSISALLHNAQAQERDSILTGADTATVSLAADAGHAAQDGVHEDTGEERRAREEADRDREKYYYKDIKKDSARLEIEQISRTAWKRPLILAGWG